MFDRVPFMEFFEPWALTKAGEQIVEMMWASPLQPVVNWRPLAYAAQIAHLSANWGKRTAKSLEKSPSYSFKKRQILDGETLTRANQTDAEREVFCDPLTLNP